MSSDQSPQPAGKSRVYFGSLEGQESIKRPRIEETTASSGGGIDLDALGTFFLLSFFKKKTNAPLTLSGKYGTCLFN